MKPLILALLATIVLAGCGSDDPNTSNSSTSKITSTEETGSVPEATEEEKREAAAEDEAESDATATRRLKKEVKLNYKSAPWYDSIEKISVTNGDALIETMLYPDSDAEGPANALCLLIGGPAVEPPPGVVMGRILASDGSTIKRCE